MPSTPIPKLALTCLECVCSVALIHLLTIFMGAPLIQQFYETLAFSTLLSIFTLLPCLLSNINRELDSTEIIERLLILRNFKTFREFIQVSIAYGAICGAWSSSFVLPLDWDRWWQVWPIPNCFGTVCGAFCGFLFSILFRFKFYVKKSKV